MVNMKKFKFLILSGFLASSLFAGDDFFSQEELSEEDQINTVQVHLRGSIGWLLDGVQKDLIEISGETAQMNYYGLGVNYFVTEILAASFAFDFHNAYFSYDDGGSSTDQYGNRSSTTSSFYMYSSKIIRVGGLVSPFAIETPSGYMFTPEFELGLLYEWGEQGSDFKQAAPIDFTYSGFGYYLNPKLGIKGDYLSYNFGVEYLESLTKFDSNSNSNDFDYSEFSITTEFGFRFKL